MENNFQKKDYRSIFKATTIFGGAQIFIILIGLIRSKFVAILLGTEGYGLNSLYNTPLTLILSITGLGISFSAIRDIVQAKASGDTERIAKVISVLKFWLRITGLLGVIVVILLSPFLSSWSFDDYSHTVSFIILSLTVYFMSLGNGYQGLLRGLQLTSKAAKASVAAPFFSTCISVPFFYFGGIKGIVPALFFNSLCLMVISYYYAKDYLKEGIKLSFNEYIKEGKEMIKLGIVMTFSVLFSQLVTYSLVLVVNYYGSISELGLYNAGISISTLYVGVVLTAIGADFFPRLTAVHQDNLKVIEVVNQQGEIIVLFLCPMLVTFIIALPFIVKILFTEQFLGIIGFVRLLMIGMLFRTISWVLAYIPGAKGDYKLFLQMEILGNIIIFILSFLFYTLWGLEGLGYAFILSYIFYAGLVYLFCKRKYKFQFLKEYRRMIFIIILIVSAAYMISYANSYIYAIGVVHVLFLSYGYSLIKLNDRLHLFHVKKF